jgi:hypothetical protein
MLSDRNDWIHVQGVFAIVLCSDYKTPVIFPVIPRDLYLPALLIRCHN